MKKDKGRIEIRESDTAQPYRVWWGKEIIFFGKTLQEAHQKLNEQKRKG